MLLLALVGFGFKAGFVPFHFWLPPAHAAAPSHVSALMSGVVIKTGIYGLLRVLLMLGGAPAWWGWIVLATGVASGILGVLWALAQHDMKRLLAYHSVENIGIILMGIGVGVLGVVHKEPAIAVLGFAGGLLHTVNHALFKSLLFLGAGAVYRATGTRNMEELGGVARRMPVTWLAFAIGAAAIVGLPPFNGFVSEWLIYQGLFAGGQSHTALRLSVLGIPALALIGAVALACFAKVAGVVFLGTPRSAHGATANDVGRGGSLPMLALAATCVALGVFPVLGVALVRVPARDLAQAVGVSIPVAVLSGAWSISALSLATIVSCAVLLWMRSALMRGRLTRHEVTWACGTTRPRRAETPPRRSRPRRCPCSVGRVASTSSARPRRCTHTRLTSYSRRRASRLARGASSRTSAASDSPWPITSVSPLRDERAPRDARVSRRRAAFLMLETPSLSAIPALLLLMLGAPIAPGIASRTKSVLTGRRGSPVWQVYADLWKLGAPRNRLQYDDDVGLSPRADRAGRDGACRDDARSARRPHRRWRSPGDVVAFAYLLGLGRFALVLAALDTGSSFEGMGASREITFAALVEPGIFVGLATLGVLAHEFSLTAMLGAAQHAPIARRGHRM